MVTPSSVRLVQLAGSQPLSFYRKKTDVKEGEYHQSHPQLTYLCLWQLQRCQLIRGWWSCNRITVPFQNLPFVMQQFCGFWKGQAAPLMHTIRLRRHVIPLWRCSASFVEKGIFLWMQIWALPNWRTGGYVGALLPPRLSWRWDLFIWVVPKSGNLRETKSEVVCFKEGKKKKKEREKEIFHYLKL